MSSGKIRLVSCPNCRSVLPESVDVPVYRCGRCGKILQAKCRQQQKDAEKSDMHGGDDIGNKASGSSRSEEDLNNVEQDNDLQLVEDELNMPCRNLSNLSQGESDRERHGFSVIAAEENSHVQGEGRVEQEIGIFTNESSSYINDQPEESQQTNAPPFFKRIMSANTCASTEYLDPYSTFSDILSEACESPTTQNIHQYGYDASVSSFDNPEDRFLSSQRDKKNGLFLADDSANGRAYEDSYHGQFKRSFKLPPRPRVPLYQSGAYHHGSEKLLKNFRHSMSYHTPASPEYIDEDRIKLLKMVHELEEQLKKTCNFQGGGVKSQKHRFTSRSHELDPQRQQWNHAHYLRSSRIPFSAEVARTDHQFPLPRDRQHSEPLSPPPYKKSIYGGCRTGRSGIMNSYSSWQSSPRQYEDSFMSPSEEDPIYGFQKMRMQRSCLKNKHLRPIARAAPFITCQNCSKCLQLPQDFLLSKGRCHRVKCGSCETVMRFSLENRIRLVPYYEEEEEDFRAPPPSEAEEFDESSMNMRTSTSNGFRDSRGKMESSEFPMGSPLHNLMGYSTVSQVFKGFRLSSNNGASSSSMPKP